MVPDLVAWRNWGNGRSVATGPRVAEKSAESEMAQKAHRNFEKHLEFMVLTNILIYP